MSWCADFEFRVTQGIAIEEDAAECAFMSQEKLLGVCDYGGDHLKIDRSFLGGKTNRNPSKHYLECM